MIVLWASEQYKGTHDALRTAFRRLRDLSAKTLGKELFVIRDEINAEKLTQADLPILAMLSAYSRYPHGT